jgi:hypothetical protein
MEKLDALLQTFKVANSILTLLGLTLLIGCGSALQSPTSSNPAALSDSPAPTPVPTPAPTPAPAPTSVPGCKAPNNSGWPLPIVTAFFVATNGSDSNTGTITSPFATFAKAQTAMQGSTTKTTYLRAGTYPRTATFTLTTADDGETWSTYPGDPVDSAVLDGGGTLETPVLINGASNVTWNGITIQNFIGVGLAVHGGASGISFPSTGTLAYGSYPETGTANGDTISNNLVLNGGFDSAINQGIFAQAGIAVTGQATNIHVFDNTVHDDVECGICGWANPQDGTHSDVLTGLEIENNLVYNIGGLGNYETLDAEPSGIYIIHYLEGGSLPADTGVMISNNYVYNYQYNSNSADRGRGIYTDNGMSNVTITGNIVGPPGLAVQQGSGGAGTTAFMVHGGDNVIVSGNIIDLGATSRDILFTYVNLPGGLAMTGNTFTGNIVLFGFTGVQNTQSFGATGPSYMDANGNGPNPVNPQVRNNVYYNYVGGSTFTNGNSFGDSAPIFANPDIAGWTYAIAAGSPVFNAPVNFPQIPGGWGPPGFILPQTGTPPFSPTTGSICTNGP